MLMDSRKSVLDSRPPSPSLYWPFAPALMRDRPTGARARDSFSRPSVRSVQRLLSVFSFLPAKPFNAAQLKNLIYLFIPDINFTHVRRPLYEFLSPHYRYSPVHLCSTVVGHFCPDRYRFERKFVWQIRSHSQGVSILLLLFNCFEL